MSIDRPMAVVMVHVTNQHLVFGACSQSATEVWCMCPDTIWHAHCSVLKL